MKINKNQSNKKRIAIIAIIFILAAIAAIAIFYFTQNKSQSDNTPSETNTPSRSESDKKQAEDLEKNPDNKSTPTNTDTPQQPTGNSADGKKTVQVVTSYDSDATNIYIRGGLNALAYDGTCYATLNGPNATTIRKDTTFMQSASTTDCKTITIKKSELTPGKWTYTLNYDAGDTSGQSNEQTFNL